MKTSDAGIALIKLFEGVRRKAYKDSVGIWTIGVGHIKGVHEGDEITDGEVDEFLRLDLVDAETCVSHSVTADISQCQFDALVSLVFNIGRENFSKSTLLRELNDGAGRHIVSDQFLRWNKAQGVVLDGLTRRRKAEAELFLS